MVAKVLLTGTFDTPTRAIRKEVLTTEELGGIGGSVLANLPFIREDLSAVSTTVEDVISVLFLTEEVIDLLFTITRGRIVSDSIVEVV